MFVPRFVSLEESAYLETISSEGAWLLRKYHLYLGL